MFLVEAFLTSFLLTQYLTYKKHVVHWWLSISFYAIVNLNAQLYVTSFLVSKSVAQLIIAFYLMQDRVTEQISLDPLTNKTGDVWHVFLKGNFENIVYGYKFDGKFSPEEGHYYDSSRMLLDPYAKVSGLYRGICLKLVVVFCLEFFCSFLSL